jgi:hypothetical protein
MLSLSKHKNQFFRSLLDWSYASDSGVSEARLFYAPTGFLVDASEESQR